MSYVFILSPFIFLLFMTIINKLTTSLCNWSIQNTQTQTRYTDRQITTLFHLCLSVYMDRSFTHWLEEYYIKFHLFILNMQGCNQYFLINSRLPTNHLKSRNVHHDSFSNCWFCLIFRHQDKTKKISRYLPGQHSSSKYYLNHNMAYPKSISQWPLCCRDNNCKKILFQHIVLHKY